MRFLLASLLCFTSLLVAPTESASIRRTEEGGLEIEVDLTEVDLKDLRRHLQEGFGGHTPTAPQFEYDMDETAFFVEDGTDASLLNQLIGFFLPHINNLFQAIVPDPLAMPVRGSFHTPEIDLAGYCTAQAGFDVSFGTLNGLKGVTVDRLRVIPGYERVDARWSAKDGCFFSRFSSVFDVAISSVNALTVDDLHAGINAKACSYTLDESISGGLNTFHPRIRGAVNVSGTLLGQVARLDFVNIVKNFDVGYSKIEGFIDGAPTVLNQAFRNITGELSALAKDEIIPFLFKNEMDQSIGPSTAARVQHAAQGAEIEISFEDALAISSGLVSNGAKKKIHSLVDGTASFLNNWGFTMGTTTVEEADPTAAEDNEDEDNADSVEDPVAQRTETFLDGAASFVGGALGDAGFQIGEREQGPQDNTVAQGPSAVENVENFLDDAITGATDEVANFVEGAVHILEDFGFNVLGHKDESDNGVAADEEASGSDEDEDEVTGDASSSSEEEEERGPVIESAANILDNIGFQLGGDPADDSDNTVAQQNPMPEIDMDAQIGEIDNLLADTVSGVTEEVGHLAEGAAALVEAVDFQWGFGSDKTEEEKVEVEGDTAAADGGIGQQVESFLQDTVDGVTEEIANFIAVVQSSGEDMEQNGDVQIAGEDQTPGEVVVEGTLNFFKWLGFGVGK